MLEFALKATAVGRAAARAGSSSCYRRVFPAGIRGSWKGPLGPSPYRFSAVCLFYLVWHDWGAGCSPISKCSLQTQVLQPVVLFWWNLAVLRQVLWVKGTVYSAHLSKKTAQNSKHGISPLALLLLYSQLLVNQGPQTHFHGAAPQLPIPPHVCISRVAPSQVHNPALALVKPHVAGDHPVLEFVEISLWPLPWKESAAPPNLALFTNLLSLVCKSLMRIQKRAGPEFTVTPIKVKVDFTFWKLWHSSASLACLILRCFSFMTWPRGCADAYWF